MASAYSDNLRLELQATGENTGTWGTLANTLFTLVGDAVASVSDITMADANYTLNTNNGAIDEARSAVLNVIGTTTAVRDIILPAYSKLYIVYNNLASGTNDIRISIGGTFVNIPFGFQKWVWTDGTSCFDATNKTTERLQDWSGSLSTTGSADAYLLTTNRVLTAYVDGEKVHCVANFTNTGAATINIDSVGVKNLRKVDISGDVVLDVNDIVSAGHYILQYDASADSAAGAWIVLNPTVAYIASSVAITGGTITGITDLAVADGGTGSSTAADAATALGLGIGDSPQFTGIELGHATDTTITKASAGDLNVEGNIVYRAGGTEVPVVDGGTGASTALDARGNLGLSTWAVEAIGQETISVTGRSMIPAVTTAPASIGSREIATSLIAHETMNFAADADDNATFGPFKMPKSWNAGTLVCEIDWSTDGSQTAGLDGVKWFVKMGCYASSAQLRTALGAAVGPAAQDHSTTADDVMTTAEFTVTAAGAAAETVLYGNVYRDTSDGGDDLDIDAELITLRIHYTINAGSDS